jgi:hypothetical protein
MPLSRSQALSVVIVHFQDERLAPDQVEVLSHEAALSSTLTVQFRIQFLGGA